MQKGDRQPKIFDEVLPILSPDRINKRQNGRRMKTNGESSFTITTQDRHGVVLKENSSYQIRKLTPLECWRLMGFSDDDFYKAKDAGLSNTKLYERAGRGIVVPMLEEIFKILLLGKSDKAVSQNILFS
jgi:DNA (cytosine-5)-methyltransferase 1